MGEQHALAYSVWTLGSFAIGVIGYALTAMGILRLSCRRRNKIYWLLVSVAMALSASIWVTGLYVFNEIRAAIFNLAAAGFLALACVQVARDFAIDRLPARYCVLASLSAATLFCILIVHAMIFPTYAAIEPRDAFFLLIICHFSIALFVVVLVQERSEARLRRLANTDALTGIPNRQHFMGHLPYGVEEGDAFLMVDIDHFKKINDCYGHEAGDEVLIGVAQAIARAAGREVAFGRLGGEEFGLFLRRSFPATAREIALKICHDVRSLRFGADEQPITTSVSVGIAVTNGTSSAKALRDRADRALYNAKRRGRDRVELYEQDDLSAVEEQQLSSLQLGS
jgi:diguanylate cyclase (GGDEF)-like protein